MKNKTDFFIALALLVFCAVVWQQVALLPKSAGAEFFSPASFPTGVSVLLAVLSLSMLVRSFRQPGESCWPERGILLRVAGMAVVVLAYVGGFILLGEYAYEAEWPGGSGFCITTFLFLAAAQWLAGYRRPGHVHVLAALITGALFVVFSRFFEVPLP